MNILFYRYKNIFEPDCISSFKYYGLDVTEIFANKDTSNEDLSFQTIASTILDAKALGQPYLFVFSINFFPALSDICQRLGIIYACWTVDCPVNELLFKQITNPCNRIFLFDYSQYLRFHPYNRGHVFYLPLATNVDKFDKCIASTTSEDIKKYSCDISFVGSLYNEKNPLSTMTLSPYARGFIDALTTAQLNLYGANFIEKALTPDIISELCGNKKDNNNDSFVEPINRFIAAHSFVGMDIAMRERILTLNELAKDFNVDLYTLSDTSPLKGINLKGPANTISQMPKIFNLSRINLNMTIRPIESGLPLRIFDVLGCRGFLITNYQSEIPELFDIGKDLEVYTSISELKEKCAYYLAHEDERQAILESGYQKVKTFHNINVRVKEMIEMMTGA